MNSEFDKEIFESSMALLNPEQRAAVEHIGSSLLILAGAGSGKTHVITTKIAYLISVQNYAPCSILAVTFTKKAAEEMKNRAALKDSRAKDCEIRTFHSIGAFLLRCYFKQAGVDKHFTVYDEDDMTILVRKVLDEMKEKGKPIDLRTYTAAKYASKISLAKDYCLPCDSVYLSEIFTDPFFPEVYEAYQKKLRATGNVDFGDLIMLPIKLLNSNEEVARHIHNRYRVIMVDEYQDSNVAQFLFLKALSGVDEGNNSYVCVVGDDDQSIYKFRGAEVQNILNFQKEFPGTDLIRLERNYRSTASILNAADKIVSKNEGRLGKTLIAERGDGKRPDLIFLPTQDDEAAFCAELISKNYAKGVPYNSWAILYRTNAQSLGFESEFLRRKIPYQVVGSLKFYEREEIKDLLCWLSFCANQKDEIAFRRIINKPTRGIGSTTQDKISEQAAVAVSSGEQGTGDSEQESPLMGSLLEAAKQVAPTLSKKAREGVEKFCEFTSELIEEINAGKSEEKLSVFVEKIMEKSGLVEHHSADDEISGTQRVANMQELANNAALYAFNMDGLLEFLDTIELDRTLASEEDATVLDSVTLITLHNTKGLEFPRVIITGLENGIFPRGDKSGAELEEERRLFYVGITRAKDELYITSCAQRRLYGRTEFMEPSSFLAEAGADVFRVLGNVPASYEYAVRGRDTESQVLDYDDGDFSDEYAQEERFAGRGGRSNRAPKINHPLAKKYPVGQTLFHDDYGYGQIVKASVKEDEYVIEVAFQSGGKKTFLPAYQASKLMRVEE